MDRTKLAGSKFGKLTVLSLHKQVGEYNYYNCQCKCGNTLILSYSSIVYNKLHSCSDCVNPNLIINDNKKYENSIIKSLYTKYQFRAKKKKLKFDIPFSYFKTIIQQLCVYCGSEPSNKVKDKRYGKITVQYNGLDRMYNDEGYTCENVVPSCKDCNSLKQSKDPIEFMIWIKKVHSNLELDKWQPSI